MGKEKVLETDDPDWYVPKSLQNYQAFNNFQIYLRIQEALDMELASDRKHSIIKKVNESIPLINLIQDIWDEREIFLDQKNESILQSCWISDCDFAVSRITKVACNHFPVWMLFRRSFKHLRISCLSFTSGYKILTMASQITQTISD